MPKLRGTKAFVSPSGEKSWGDASPSGFAPMEIRSQSNVDSGKCTRFDFHCRL